MSTKQATFTSVQEFIATHGVTRCAPGKRQAPSLRKLRHADDLARAARIGPKEVEKVKEEFYQESCAFRSGERRGIREIDKRFVQRGAYKNPGGGKKAHG